MLVANNRVIQRMVSRSFDDFLLAFGQANAFVFNTTVQMQNAAKNMWEDIKDRQDEVEAFIKEVSIISTAEYKVEL